MINKDKLNEEIKRLRHERSKMRDSDLEWTTYGQDLRALSTHIDLLESIYNCLD